jgi:hypothetical protein
LDALQRPCVPVSVQLTRTGRRCPRPSSTIGADVWRAKRTGKKKPPEKLLLLAGTATGQTGHRDRSVRGGKRRGASLHVPRFFFPHAGRRGPARVVIDDGDGATTGGAEHMHGARRSGSAASSPLSAGVDGSLDAVPLAQLGRLLLPETQTPRQRQPAACRSVWTFDRL